MSRSLLEHEAGRGRGPAGVGVEHRDDHRHVATTDRGHEVEPEHQRQHRHQQQRDQGQVAVIGDEPHREAGGGDEDGQVEQVASGQHERARGHPAAQLGPRHDRAGEGHGTDEDADVHLDVVHGVRAAVVVQLQPGVVAHQHGGDADEAVQHGHQLGHAGHLDRAGAPGADRAADDHRDEDQGQRHAERALVAVLAVAGRQDERGEQRQAHAPHAEEVAPLGGLVLRQAGQRPDEQDAGDDVRRLDEPGQACGGQEVAHVSPS